MCNAILRYIKYKFKNNIKCLNRCIEGKYWRWLRSFKLAVFFQFLLFHHAEVLYRVHTSRIGCYFSKLNECEKFHVIYGVWKLFIFTIKKNTMSEPWKRYASVNELIDIFRNFRHCEKWENRKHILHTCRYIRCRQLKINLWTSFILDGVGHRWWCSSYLYTEYKIGKCMKSIDKKEMRT